MRDCEPDLPAHPHRPRRRHRPDRRVDALPASQDRSHSRSDPRARHGARRDRPLARRSTRPRTPRRPRTRPTRRCRRPRATTTPPRPPPASPAPRRSRPAVRDRPRAAARAAHRRADQGPAERDREGARQAPGLRGRRLRHQGEALGPHGPRRPRRAPRARRRPTATTARSSSQLAARSASSARSTPIIGGVDVDADPVGRRRRPQPPRPSCSTGYVDAQRDQPGDRGRAAATAPSVRITDPYVRSLNAHLRELRHPPGPLRPPGARAPEIKPGLAPLRPPDERLPDQASPR